MTVDVYQAGLTQFIPDAWKLAQNGYRYHLWGQLRRITRELPGDRYPDEEIVDFAYQYTTEDAIKRLELNTNKSTEGGQ